MLALGRGPKRRYHIRFCSNVAAGHQVLPYDSGCHPNEGRRVNVVCPIFAPALNAVSFGAPTFLFLRTLTEQDCQLKDEGLQQNMASGIRLPTNIALSHLEFIFLLQGLKKSIRCCVMYCQGQKTLGLSESERMSSEEPRASVSVFQTVGVLDAAYGIFYVFLWEVSVLVLDGLREDT